jgi:cell division cycle protein 37
LQEMKECFEKKDIGMLQAVVMKMEKEDAEYHIKRCVDSGLWVPNAEDQQAPSTSVEGQDEEEIYEDATDK